MKQDFGYLTIFIAICIFHTSFPSINKQTFQQKKHNIKSHSTKKTVTFYFDPLCEDILNN